MMMDCQQAFALLQDILDKEASQIDEKEVRAHLKKCGHCFERFRVEESIQEFLNEKIKTSFAVEEKSDKLESMRLDIMGHLDEIDAECQESKKTTFGSPFKIFLSAAALVLLASIWSLSTGFFSHQEYYIPLEQAHWAAAENSSVYTQGFDKAEYLGIIEQNFNYNINSSFDGYSFVGAKKEQIMGNDVEHLIFPKDDDCISIFITSADTFVIPDNIKATMIKNSNQEIYDHNCRGCRLIFHKVGSLMIITASTNKEIELADFIPGHLTI